MWERTESNRRHEDFQSSALPTELPSHQKINPLSKESETYHNRIRLSIAIHLHYRVETGLINDWFRID